MICVAIGPLLAQTAEVGAPGAAVLLSSLALLLGVANAIISGRQARARRRAAGAADLYPVLRGFREAAAQSAKPLGGGGMDNLVAVHYGLIDLADLEPAVADKVLVALVNDLLESDAAQIALSIDPPRFMGMFGDLAEPFRELSISAQAAVEQCQTLRRGFG